MTKIFSAQEIRARFDDLATVRDRDLRVEGLLELAQGIRGSENNLQLFFDAFDDNRALERLARRYAPPSEDAPSVRYDRLVVCGGSFAAHTLIGAKVPNTARSVSERARLLAGQPPPFIAPSGAAAMEKSHNIPVGSYLRLDDVADFLLSPAGEAVVERALQHFLAHGGDPNAPTSLPSNSIPDPLAKAIQGYFITMRFEGVLRSRLSGLEVSALMPSAIVSALGGWTADESGRVSVGAMLRHFGSKATALLCDLSAQLDHGQKAVQSERGRAKYRYLPDGIAPLLSKSVASSDIDSRMSGFWNIVNELATPETLQGFTLVERGHMTESTEVLLRAFVGAGAKQGPLLGKSYSANADVLHRAKELGWDVAKRTLVNPELDIDQVIYALDHFLGKAAHARQLLIVDDGFELSGSLHELVKHGWELNSSLERIVAVEQTEKGKHRCKELQEQDGFELTYPVFDMAGSWLKKRFESPAIGESVAFQIDYELWAANPDLIIEPKEAAIIGFGAVGSATAKRLKARGYKVFVYDIDPDKMVAAAEAGYDVGGFPAASGLAGEALEKALDRARDQVFAHGHLTVGCTPSTCLERGEYGKLPNHAVLANAGSGYAVLGEPEVAKKSDDALVESEDGFDSRQKMDQRGKNIDGGVRLAMPGLVDYRDIPGDGDVLRDDKESVDGRGMRHNVFKGLDLTTGDVAARDRNFHCVARDPDGSERLVLRNGGVVNIKFDLPPEYAQITRALLFVSAVLAAQNVNAMPGWNELPDDLQHRMLEIVEADLASKGLSLTEPDFMKTPPVGSEAFVEAMMLGQKSKS